MFACALNRRANMSNERCRRRRRRRLKNAQLKIMIVDWLWTILSWFALISIATYVVPFLIGAYLLSEQDLKVRTGNVGVFVCDLFASCLGACVHVTKMRHRAEKVRRRVGCRHWRIVGHRTGDCREARVASECACFAVIVFFLCRDLSR